jgi:hypothetical protein
LFVENTKKFPEYPSQFLEEPNVFGGGEEVDKEF